MKDHGYNINKKPSVGQLVGLILSALIPIVGWIAHALYERHQQTRCRPTFFQKPKLDCELSRIQNVMKRQPTEGLFDTGLSYENNADLSDAPDANNDTKIQPQKVESIYPSAPSYYQ